MTSVGEPTTRPPHWSAPHVALLRRCFPLDLPGPCYMLSAEESGDWIADWFAWMGRPAIAYTRMFLDCELRPVLERLGLWEGEGPAMIFRRADFLDGLLDQQLATLRQSPDSTEHHEAWYRQYFLETYPGSSDACRLEVAIHELAHCLDNEDLRRAFRSSGYEPSEWPNAEGVLQSTLREIDPQRSPWAYHEARWIRCVVHLAHRALWTVPLCLDRLHVAGAVYGLSHRRFYSEALETELDALESVPVVDILSRPYPPAFAELWKRDTGEFLPTDSPGSSSFPRADASAPTLAGSSFDA